MTRLALAGLVALLGACAAVDSPAVQTARNVCALAYGDPALDPIRDRIPIDDDAAVTAPMGLLADARKPNGDELRALQLYDAANRRCWDARDQAGTSPLVQNARAQVSSALAELYSGRIGYGEFNRRRANAIADMNVRLREAEERERAAAYSRNRGIMFCDAFGRGPVRTLHCW